MEQASWGYVERPSFLDREAVPQDFTGWSPYEGIWGDPPTRRLIAQGGGEKFFPTVTAEEEDVAKLLENSCSLAGWKEKIREGHFFVSLAIGTNIIFGGRALRVASLIKPSAPRGRNSPTVERRSRSIHFTLPEVALGSILAGHYKGNDMESISEAITCFMTTPRDDSLVPEVEDMLTDELARLLRRPRGNYATAEAFRRDVQGAWHPPSHHRVWTAVVACCSAAHTMAIHTRDPDQLRLLGALMAESMQNATLHRSPFPSVSFAAIHDHLKKDQGRIENDVAFDRVIRWQEIADLSKIPMEKGIMLDPEAIREQNAADFDRPLDDEVEIRRSDALRALGYETFRDFARDGIAAIIVPKSGKTEAPYRALETMSVEDRYEFGDIPEEGYRPSPSATISVGQRDGGQIRYETEVLKARIASGEDEFTENPILSGPEEYLRRCKEEGYSVEWMSRHKRHLERMMTKSARLVHREELDRTDDPDRNDDIGIPFKVSQTIWDENNQNFRGLVNQEQGNLYGGLIPYLERVLHKHQVCYKKAPTNGEMSTLGKMQNESFTDGMNKTVVASEDATKSTALADRMIVHATADVIQSAFREQVSEDDLRAIRRNALTAKLVRLPEREPIPTLSCLTGRLRPELADSLPLLWTGEIVKRSALGGRYEEITNHVVEALLATETGLAGLKAATGSGKTVSTILALASYCAETGRKADFIMDTQASVNSMCFSCTGRSPIFTSDEDNPDALWENDSPLAELSVHTRGFGVDLREETIGFTHGGIMNPAERRGLLSITSIGSWIRRQERDPSDLVVVDEADEEQNSVSFVLGEKALRRMNVLFISATLDDIPGLRGTNVIVGAPPRIARTTRIGSSNSALLQFCRKLSNPNREGGICLIICNSIRDCESVGTAFFEANFQIGTFDGQMDSELGRSELSPPEEGIKFVAATTAIRRSDLKNVGLCICPAQLRRQAQDDAMLRGVCITDITQSEIQQYGGRAARGGFSLFMVAGENPVHVAIRGEQQNVSYPMCFEGSAYSHGLAMGQSGYPLTASVWEMTDRQAREYGFGHAQGYHFFTEERVKTHSFFATYSDRVREWIPGRVLSIRGANTVTQMAAIILGEGLSLGISEPVLIRSLGFDEGRSLAAELGAWYQDPFRTLGIILDGDADVVGMGWKLLREYLSPIEDTETEINWNDVAEACPDFLVGYDGATLNGRVHTDVDHFGHLLLQRRSRRRGSPFEAIGVGIDPIFGDVPATCATSFGNLSLTSQTLSFSPQAGRGGPEWDDKIAVWKNQLLEAFSPQEDDVVGYQTRGWSLADLFSVLLLAITKELQGIALRAIVASEECYNLLIGGPTLEEHFVGGAQVKFAVKAVQASYDIVRFTLNQKKTGFSTIMNADTRGSLSIIGAPRGVANTIGGGDDGGDIISYREDESALGSELQSRVLFDKGLGFMNFMQLLAKFEADWNGGRPFFSCRGVSHLKTRGTMLAVMRLNPGLQLSLKKEPFIKTVADLMNLGHDAEYRRNIIAFLAPYMRDYIWDLQQNYCINTSQIWVEMNLPAKSFPIHALSRVRNYPLWSDLVQLASPMEERKGAASIESFSKIALEQEAPDRKIPCNRKVREGFNRFWENHGALFFAKPSRGKTRYLSNRELKARLTLGDVPHESHKDGEVPDWFMALYEIHHPREPTAPENDTRWEEIREGGQEALLRAL